MALATLLKRAKYNPKKDQLVLMGDYVNNGPDSFGTLKLVNSRKNACQRLIFLFLLFNQRISWLPAKAIAPRRFNQIVKIKRLSVGMRSYVNYLLLK
jgi:serine/threonine protein phosphatase 1